MKKIEISNDSKTQPEDRCEIVELCDIEGQAHAVFASSTVSEVLTSCPYSTEELAEMENETGGRELSEIWKSLGV